MPLSPTVEHLRTSGLAFPLAVDTPPEFSWRTAGADPDTRIESGTIALTRAAEPREPVWIRNWTPPAIPAVLYDGPPLEPRTRYFWRVGIQLSGRDEKVWSEPAFFETGIGNDLPRLARWIGLEVTEPPNQPTRVQYLRKRFSVPGSVIRARAYATALGWYGLSVNDADVTGNSIAPRFAAFDRRVEYRAYDITDAVTVGENSVELRLAEGRYRGRNSAEGTRAVYGNQLASMALLEIECANGTIVTVGTDADWRGSDGPLVTADPQEGTRIDARVTMGEAAHPTSESGRQLIVLTPQVSVVAAVSEPVRLLEERPPLSITELDGRIVVDFGQNLVGVTRLVVSGDRGQEITVTHSEVLNPDGHLDIDYLDMSGGMLPRIDPIDHYTLGGAPEEVFEPRFTLHGFRYAELDGVTVDQIHHITALVIGADLDYYSEFHSSHAGLERLHENIRWSMRGNFTDAPTDDPTRERSGWTGDAQVFAPAAVLLADVRLFLEDWLRDVALQQDPDGAVLDRIPRDTLIRPEAESLYPGKGAAGWGDAIILIPWTLYQHYGRTAVLDENWDAMVAWVEFCRRRAANNRHPDRAGSALAHEIFIIDTGFHWGEWLEPGTEPGGEGPSVETFLKNSSHPDAEVATAYFAYSAHLLAQIARILGKDTHAKALEELWLNVRDAYRAEFLDSAGLPCVISQAKLVRPLMFDLLPTDARDHAARRLAELIRANGSRLATGFLSTGLLLTCLSDSGHDEIAVDLLLQEEHPSWLGQLKTGATTMLETWQGRHNGKANGSQNHYALGAVARWMYEHLAGLRRIAPGWTDVHIRPVLDARLDHVAASTMTPFGRLGSAWRRQGEGWIITVHVPAGIRARLADRELTPGVSTWMQSATGTVTPMNE
ncbi:glycoside hydrolase family 78 protein [Nocardia vinacea]|uniref:family 78 glycoside hydrolase catalytic domain n=1 Tax=Nocardia vinacea TaxID=96468 RepID=UPI002E0D727C|nr:glycoside hydrolase family 78 protein [Nocardia vinacea]